MRKELARKLAEEIRQFMGQKHLQRLGKAKRSEHAGSNRQSLLSSLQIDGIDEAND